MHDSQWSLGKRKVLLYRPCSNIPTELKAAPLALLCISRLLDTKTYETVIVSGDLYEAPHDVVIDACEDAVCLGISALTGPELLDCVALARSVRDAYPGLPIVWGGWHPSLNAEQTAQSELVDVVVRGQGEVTFAETVDALTEGAPLHHVDGISFKNGEEVYHCPDREISDINLFPDIPYNLINVEKTLFHNEWAKRGLDFLSSYGCPFDCAFCCEASMNKRKLNALEPGRVAEQVESLVVDYAIDGLAMYDSLFFSSETRVRLFCEELLRRNLSIKWFEANGRISQLLRYDDATWDLIVRSGCTNIVVGAESGLQEALNLIDKDLRVEETVMLAEKCRRYDLSVTFSILCGLPWDMDRSEAEAMVGRELRHSIQLADRLLSLSPRNIVVLRPFTPYPGARLFSQAVQKGLLVPTCLEEWAQWSSFERCDPLNTPWITAKQASLIMFVSKGILPYLHESFSNVMSSQYSRRSLRVLKRLLMFSYLLSVRMRWRLKIFAFPAESRLYALSARLVDMLQSRVVKK